MNKIYDQDDNGKWRVTEFQPQCPSTFLDSKCQGVDDHQEEHWCYKADGTYVEWHTGGGGSWIPPSHKKWVSPLDKVNEYYYCNHTTTEVTDPDLIIRIEAGEVDDPVTAPCTQEEIDELERLGRI
jgi:hypothetical protein